MSEKLLFSVDEGAAALGIGRAKLWDLIAQGQIASVKLGSRRLIPAAALREYADSLPLVEIERVPG